MGISINGAPVWKKGFGFIEAEKQPNPDTLYPIGSVSKQFTAFAILKLIKAGAEVPFSKQSLSLDTPVSHFFENVEKWGDIRVRHLLTMTSGVPSCEAISLKEELTRAKKNIGSSAEIGRRTLAIQNKEKEARDLEATAADIDAAVFDLKAVNPNAVSKIDTRTPAEIVASIEAHGRTVSDALARLTEMMVSGHPDAVGRNVSSTRNGKRGSKERKHLSLQERDS